MKTEVYKRLVKEHDELLEKVGKLQAFIVDNPEYRHLDEENQFLLRSQFDLMDAYLRILKRRININKI